MDDRRADSLTDDALDREIRAALRVQPSPEFVARIRTHVAGERIVIGWWAQRPWLLAASALASLAVAIVLWQATRVPVPASALDDIRIANGAPVDPEAAGITASVTPRPAVPSAEPIRHPGPAIGGRLPVDTRLPDGAPVAAAVAVERERAMPEVLVSEDERRALEWLVTQARGRQVEQPVAAVRPVAEAELPEVTIAPLRIEALPQLARLE